MTPKNIGNSAAHNKNSDQELADLRFMRLALKLARLSEARGDVPVGAVVVDKSGNIVAKGLNLREQKQTCLGHAEMQALHLACRKRQSWRLSDCTLYVTLEPCFMCSGALLQARIGRVVFAARDPKGGALLSLAQLNQHRQLNHRFPVTEGVCEADSREILQSFFKRRRQENKKKS
jgi:tRNA(adenine34) deaminase